MTTLIEEVLQLAKFKSDAPFSKQKVSLSALLEVVKDNGIGFDSALEQRLFEPFERLH